MICSNKISAAVTVWLALGAALAAAPALAVDGGCAQWDVSGAWAAVQTNEATVSLTLQQAGAQFHGNASYDYIHNIHHDILIDDEERRTDSGPIVGTVTGNSFEATVYWSKNQIGIYTGQIGPQGLIVGSTYDKNDPQTRADWHSNRVVSCQASVVIAPPMALGRVKEPPKALGRVGTAAPRDPNMTMCDYARSAKARNSPAAPNLERQCLAGGGSMTPPPPAPVAAPDLDALAAVGAKLAEQDPAVAEARTAEAGAFYQLGFDIASGIFGDPALGAKGNTLMGPGSEAIRATLSAAGQRGFDASVKFHQARDYKH